MAVADGGNTTVTDYGGVDVLLGNGDGTFQPAKQFSAFANPNSIALGDFNGDGKLDMEMATPTCCLEATPGTQKGQ